MNGYIDMARLVADRLLIGGWLICSTPPTQLRITDYEGNVAEAALLTVIWIERPDIAKLHPTGPQGDSVAFIIETPAGLLNTILGLHGPVHVALLDSKGNILLDGSMRVLPVTLEEGRIAKKEWVVDQAIDAGVFSPAIARALRLLGTRPDEQVHGYVEFGVRVGNGALLSGWIPNAAGRELMIMSGGAESCRIRSDLALVERSDIHSAMDEWGLIPITSLHGYTTSFPLLFGSTRSVHVFECSAIDETVQLLGTFEMGGGSLEMAYSTFMAHFGKGRFPPPAVAEYHLRPLLAVPRPSVAEPRIFAVKTADKPIGLSVIVPLYGRQFFVRSLLQNQCRYPDDTEFVYVCDDPRLHEFVINHFSDRSALIARPTKIVLNPTNLGYSASNNIGVAHSQGEVLLFQNSDIWVAQSSDLCGAYKTLQGTEKFGVLGFRLLYEDGTLQHDGLTFETGAAVHDMFLAEHRGKGLPPPVACGIDEVPAVTGAMLMVKRRWFNILGGFDPGYVRGDFEDADFCLRLAEAGGSVGIVRSDSIYHLERQSIALTGGDAEQLLITYLNCNRFNQRWGDYLADLAA